MKKHLVLLLLAGAFALAGAPQVPEQLEPRLPRKITVGKTPELVMAKGGRANFEIVVPADAAYLGIPLSRLTVDPDSLVAVIVRGTKVIVPFGSDTIEAGDHVVVMTKRSGIVSLDDILKD